MEAKRKLRKRRHLLTLPLLVGLWTVPPPASAENEQPPAAAPNDSAAIRQEIDALKQRIQALEQELARSRQAPTAPVKPVPNAEALQTTRGSRVQVSGYVEIRGTNIGSATGNRTTNRSLDFQATRFRPRISYRMDPHFLATLQLNASTRSDAATSVNTRDAFLEYGNAGYFLRMGQQKIPYGFQVFREGDEPRAALERARVFGVVFPDERDIGLTLTTAPKNQRSPIFAVGVVNGDGINRSDQDRAKSVSGNVIVPLGRSNVVGGSYYTGTTTSVVTGKTISQVKRAYGFEHRLNLGRLGTQLEYLWGRAGGADLNGGYGQIAYASGQIGSFFVRHDIFDPNEDATNDYWRRTSLGWFKDFTPQFRLTAEYDLVKNKLTPTSHDDTFGLEVQGNF
jgi:hypothetical protein